MSMEKYKCCTIIMKHYFNSQVSTCNMLLVSVETTVETTMEAISTGFVNLFVVKPKYNIIFAGYLFTSV